MSRELESFASRIKGFALKKDLKGFEAWGLLQELEKLHKTYGSEKICLFVEREYMEMIMNKVFDEVKNFLKTRSNE